MAQWVEGTIVSNERWTENLFSLKVEAEADEFIAGQFTSLALDIDGERVARPYSYLTSPGQQPLEFFLYRALGGALSTALIAKEPGEKVWVKTPANGFFVLREIPPCEEMWMLATGTGISPYFSILNVDEPWQRFKRVVLVHAVRLEVDLRYGEIVDTLQARYGERFVFPAFCQPGSRARRNRGQDSRGDRRWRACAPHRHSALDRKITLHALRQPRYGARYHRGPQGAWIHQKPPPHPRAYHHRKLLVTARCSSLSLREGGGSATIQQIHR